MNNFVRSQSHSAHSPGNLCQIMWYGCCLNYTLSVIFFMAITTNSKIIETESYPSLSLSVQERGISPNSDLTTVWYNPTLTQLMSRANKTKSGGNLMQFEWFNNKSQSTTGLLNYMAGKGQNQRQQSKEPNRQKSKPGYVQEKSPKTPRFKHNERLERLTWDLKTNWQRMREHTDLNTPGRVLPKLETVKFNGSK